MKLKILIIFSLFLILGCIQNAHVAQPSETTIVESPDLISDDKKVIMNLTGVPDSYVEGQLISLTINFDKPTEYVGNFSWSISGSDKDFQESSGVVHLPKGSTGFPLVLRILNDTDFEADETFTLSITSSVASNSISLPMFVPNNDVAPTLSITASGAKEGDSGKVTFKLTNTSYQAIILDYVVSDVTATYSSDLSFPGGQSGTLTIPPGQLMGTLTWNATNDAVVESSTETAHITISKNVLSGNVTYTTGGLGSGYQVLNIYDDDLATIHAYFTETSQTLYEDVGTAYFQINLNKASPDPVDISLSVAGTMGNPKDHNLSSSVVRFQPGETSKVFPFQIVDDSLPELNQNVSMSLPSGILIFGATWIGPTSTTLNIIDNDGHPVINFSQAASTISESGGWISIPFTLDRPKGDTFNMIFSVSGTTSSLHDYGTLFTSISVIEGATSGAINISITDDLRDELDETIQLKIEGSSSYIIGDSTIHTVTVIDNDDQPTIDILPVTQKEGCGAVFHVKLSAIAHYPVTFDFTTISGTAMAGSDFATTTGSRVIPPGRQGIGIYVPLLTDALSDTDETFSVTISNVNGATIGTVSANATIKDSFLTYPSHTSISPSGIGDPVAAIDKNSCYVVTLGNPLTDDSKSQYMYYLNIFDSNPIPISDEGETILAVQAFSELPSRVLMQKRKTVANDVYLIAENIDGSERVDLTPSGAAVFNNLKMTSNGQKYMFSAGALASTRQDFYLVDALSTTAPTTPFINCGSNPGCINPNHKLELVGNKLVYLSDSRVSGQFELYVQDVTGGAAIKLHADLATGRSIRSFQITPDTSKVVYVSDKSNSVLGTHDLFSVNLDGTGELKINSVGNEGVFDFGISANSAKVTWIQGAGKAVVANLDGTSQTEIGANDGNHGIHATKSSTLKFSPDHSYVVGCLYDNVSTKYHLFSYKVDGSAAVTLRDNADVQCNFAFSTDSVMVVYSAGTSTYFLYTESINGGTENTIFGAAIAHGFGILDVESSTGFLSYRAKISVNDYNYVNRIKMDGTATGSFSYYNSSSNTSTMLVDKTNNFLLWMTYGLVKIRNLN